jgi:hypothetical protein
LEIKEGDTMKGLDFNDDIDCTSTRRNVRNQFDRKRSEGKLSKAHDIDHVIAVSNIAGVTARSLMKGQAYDDMADRASILAAIAGNLHDYHREAKETEPHGPVGAEHLKELWVSGEVTMDTQEFDSTYRSIHTHEASLPELLQIFGDPIGDHQQILPAVIAFSLKTGDGILEASGYRVLERRAFFVGKERMHGDLKDIFRYPEESDLAVIGETLRRLYGKLPIDSYPEWIKQYGEKLHAVQYLLLKGLLEYRGLDEAQAAELMEKNGFPKFEGIGDKVRAQRHLDGGYFTEEKHFVLAQEIASYLDLSDRQLDQLAEASDGLVSIIAQSESQEEGIERYGEIGLDNQFRDRFYRGMKGYRESGEDFVREFEKNITNAVERISFPDL